MSISRRIRFVVFGTAAALVAALSLMPGDQLPPTGVSDRVHHLVSYALLALVGAWSYGPSTRLAALLVIYGAVIEVLQQLMGFGRHADVVDVLFNALGVVIGLSLALAVRRARR